MRPVTANSLSIAEVRSAAGEDLGKVVDFMLDTERGRVVYAVLATGGVLGVGAKMLAIPPESLRLRAERNCLELDVDTALLDAAPGIDRANPPSRTDFVQQQQSAPLTDQRGRNHG
jgi:uncharacterized protein YrrD